MKKKIIVGIAIVIAAILLFKYFFKKTAEKEEYYTDYTGDITVIQPDGEVPSRDFLAQNWSDEIREDFWFTSQGSDVMPYNWFTFLEQPDTTALFRNTDYLESFGYLPEKSSLKNPSGLPIGFTITRYRNGIPRALGFNCAACHTNQLNYNGKRYLIEGAPSVANFDRMNRHLVKALQQTLEDDQKFDRFAKNVLGEQGHSEENADGLRLQLRNVYNTNKARQLVNDVPAGYPTDFSGNGRVDAFGVIMNQGTAFGLNDWGNKDYPTAPVSYPFLWGTHQSDVVQWNASAPNTPVVGPLARNVGEVVGVFGNLEMVKSGSKIRYYSTVDYHGLGQLETWVKDLRSPQWSADFPSIDANKATMGEGLFKKECMSCHQIISREDEGMLYIANQTPVSELGTDPLTADNIQNHKARTLILEGTKQSVIAGAKFGPTARSIEIPVSGVVGLILQNPVNALEAGLAPLKSDGTEGAAKDIEEYLKENAEKRKKQQESGLVYKGRPLNGIWATAPYLHNGSVPNLWDLLQVPDKRTPNFQVGNRTFDPKNVGYILMDSINGKNPFIYRVFKEDGTIMPGNSNRGHLYGTQLTDEEKWALIEYMKTL